MEYTRLGRTGLSVSRTSFGALPIQRIPEEQSTAILRAAYEAGINFYDTANAYTDSEYKLGRALGDVRKNIIIATKTAPAAPELMQQRLEQSLKMLKTDYIDIYQLHCAPKVYRPDEEDGIYDWILQKKREGVIRHIAITAHRITVAEEALESGLYDTLQYPFSVLADEREIKLVQRAAALDIGFIAMKAMAGGLIRHPLIPRVPLGEKLEQIAADGQRGPGERKHENGGQRHPYGPFSFHGSFFLLQRGGADARAPFRRCAQGSKPRVQGALHFFFMHFHPTPPMLF